MPDLRDMELLAALARNRHFGRAAAECGISQPAFSERIRNLELDLGAPIVKRGNRFMGFTQEGEIALRWAHQMIADARGLRQEIDRARGVLSGQLLVGAVPTTLTFVANIAAQLRKAHPALTIQVFSHSSAEISQGLEDFSLDAGVTYLESTLPAASASEAIYAERYELLLPRALAPDLEGEISWRAAARFPLCLLTRNMLNRRFIDEAFQAAGAEPNLVMETNAFTAALVQVSSGTAATIAPEVMADSIAMTSDVLRLRLVEPLVEKPIGVVISEREPVLPAVEALMSCMKAARQ
ncbi:MAG: LysR family transcriptional regulator [Kiloniellales bacterium]|nr:LysR family transcriptional regulator [Kiloniellales bacterium]